MDYITQPYYASTIIIKFKITHSNCIVKPTHRYLILRVHYDDRNQQNKTTIIRYIGIPIIITTTTLAFWISSPDSGSLCWVNKSPKILSQNWTFRPRSVAMLFMGSPAAALDTSFKFSGCLFITSLPYLKKNVIIFQIINY